MSKSSAKRVSRRVTKKTVNPKFPKISEPQRKRFLALQKKKDMAISEANLRIAEFNHETTTAVLALDVPTESSALCLDCGRVRPLGTACPCSK